MAQDRQPGKSAAPKSAARKPGRLSRRTFLKAALGLAAGSVALGAYGRWVEPTWVEVVERDLPVTGLPPAWDGARVCLMADFHHSSQVPLDYLAGAVRQARALLPDLVVLGGDYLTGAAAYGERVAGLFEKMDAPLGVVACLGNHDYGYVSRPSPQPLHGPLAHVEALRASGVRVLLNEAVRLERGGQALWVAGVEDYWARRCWPVQAMQSVPAGAPNLVLCHNPDAAEDLEQAGCGTILSGHTHGGQVRIPFFGPPRLPVVHRDRYEGLHRVGRSWLYINRGLGWIVRIRINCRPEISLLTLRPATV